MAKWKCEICGDEFDNFHAQGFDNKIYCPLCYFKKENQELKEVIDKVMNLIKKYGKYDGEKCTQGFQMWSADFNKILDILKEVSE